MVVRLLLVALLLFIAGCSEDPVFANPDLYELTEQVQELQKHVDQLAQAVLTQQKEIEKLKSEDVYINDVTQEAMKNEISR